MPEYTDHPADPAEYLPEMPDIPAQINLAKADPDRDIYEETVRATGIDPREGWYCDACDCHHYGLCPT